MGNINAAIVASAASCATEEWSLHPSDDASGKIITLTRDSFEPAQQMQSRADIIAAELSLQRRLALLQSKVMIKAKDITTT
jgi:hypothetical protein